MLRSSTAGWMGQGQLLCQVLVSPQILVLGSITCPLWCPVPGREAGSGLPGIPTHLCPAGDTWHR